MGRIQNSDGAQNKHKRGITGTQASPTGMQGGRATLESRLKVLGKQNKVLPQDPTVWFFGIFSHTADFAVAPLCLTLRPHELHATRQASLSITDSRSSLRLTSTSRRCHPAISSSVVPFSSCLQSFPASGSFPVSSLFAKGLELQLQHQFFQWIFRVGSLWTACFDLAVQGTLKSLLQHFYEYTKNCRLMSSAALPMIVQIWKQPRCPSVDEQINKLQSIQTIFSTKGNELSSREKT